MTETKKELIWRHVYSFAKTYFTAFIVILYFADQHGIDIFDLVFLESALKSCLLVIIRNAYKQLTEPNERERIA